MTTATVTRLATPVVSDRRWASALAPRSGGGWNYIGQLYNYPNGNPTEWVVMNLDTGAYTIDTDTPYVSPARGLYCSGSRYLIANQKRAPNGRIFFPAVNTCLWYYDPSDQRVHQWGYLTGTPHDDSLYDIRFNTDGSLLLGGTIAAAQVGNGQDHRPQFVTFDPVALTSRNYGRVGSSNRSLNGYAYYVHSDGVGSPHAYVIVGQQFWEWVDVNLDTGVMTTLATTSSTGRMFFAEKPEGLVIQVYENYSTPSQTLTEYWTIDGVLYPYSAGYNPATLPFTPRSVTAYNNAISNPPDIDETTLPASIGWRAHGSSSDYTRNPFTLTYTVPIVLESLLALDDGSLFGNAQQYSGFFRYYPSNGALDYFGTWQSGVSEGDPRLLVGSLAYVSGYPNGLLFEYDRTKSWTQTARIPLLNPGFKGAYSNGTTLSGVKRASVLAYGSSKDRVYMVGLQDRSGFGAGVGYWDRTAKVFAGLSTNLDTYTDDMGIVVFNTLTKVIIGGKNSAGDGQLITYDLDLVEQRRDTPIVGMSSSGRQYRSSESNVLISFSGTDSKMYRWNVQTNTLLSQASTASLGALGTITQDAADTVLAVFGTTLYRVNLLTLATTSLGDMGIRPSHLAYTGGVIYGVYSTDLYSITPNGGGGFGGGGPDPAIVKVRRIRDPLVPYLGAGIGRLT